MTQTETREALRDNDTNLTTQLLEQIIAASNIDVAAELLQRIQIAERANTVEDICIDLNDFGQAEAVEIIEANY
jgi:hypothetical protein